MIILAAFSRGFILWQSPKLVLGPPFLSILSTYLSQTSTPNDHHLLSRRSVGRSNTLNCVNILLSVDYLTKYGVLAVEMRGWNCGNEELRSIAVSTFRLSVSRTKHGSRIRKELGVGARIGS